MATLVYYRMQQLSRGFRTLWGSKYRKLKGVRGSPDIDLIANGLEIGGLKATK